MQSFQVMRDWITKAGLRAAVLQLNMFDVWNCGYVAVPETHPLHGRGLMDLLPIKVKMPGRYFAVNQPPKFRWGYPILVNYFDVHGLLTYADPGADGYPIVSSEDLWWFGFDCHHVDDTLEKCTVSYVVHECERLAAQLAVFSEATDE